MNALQQPNIAATPAKVEFDFQTYEAQLKEYIADYNLVVTNDTVAGAKKAATELNKLSTSIGKALREHEKEIEAPAKELGGYRKTLVELIQEGRKSILDQVEVFEQAKLDKARELLLVHLNECREVHGVTEEFYGKGIEDLVRITAVNADSTKLIKAARDAVEALVVQESNVQKTVEMRLNSIELESHRAGLATPITRSHVNAFLLASDQEWQSHLASIIQSEVERERNAREAAEQRAEQQRIETEAKHKAEIERVERETASKAQAEAEAKVRAEQPVHEPVKQAEGAADKVVRVMAYFDVTVPDHVDAQAVARRVEDRLAEAGVAASKVWL